MVFEEVRSITTTPDGAVWFASWGSGVARLKGASWRVFTEDDLLPSNFCSALTADANGAIWIATIRGAAKICDDQIQVFSNVPELSSRLTHVATGPGDQIWFGDRKGRVIGFLATGYDPLNHTPKNELLYSWRLVSDNAPKKFHGHHSNVGPLSFRLHYQQERIRCRCVLKIGIVTLT